MSEQHGLDLRRVDVDAAADDDVGAPVAQVEETLLVEVADVAKGEPAVADRAGGLVRIVLVVEGAAVVEPDLALDTDGRPVRLVVAELQTETIAGLADRAGVGQPGRRIDADAAALGAAVELVEHRAQPLDHRPLGVGGDRGRAMHDHPQRRQVVAAV